MLSMYNNVNSTLYVKCMKVCAVLFYSMFSYDKGTHISILCTVKALYCCCSVFSMASGRLIFVMVLILRIPSLITRYFSTFCVIETCNHMINYPQAQGMGLFLIILVDVYAEIWVNQYFIPGWMITWHWGRVIQAFSGYCMATRVAKKFGIR